MFDWAMENMSIWASLDIESRNAKTLGRAYTCGVSNMGRYPFETQVRPFVLIMRPNVGFATAVRHVFTRVAIMCEDHREDLLVLRCFVSQ